MCALAFVGIVRLVVAGLMCGDDGPVDYYGDPVVSVLLVIPSFAVAGGDGRTSPSAWGTSAP